MTAGAGAGESANTGDIVIGIDSSTQSTKAIAWSRSGEALAEGRAPIPMSTPRTGWFEQDPGDWTASTATALNEVTAAIDPARIAAVAISNQRETAAFLGADGAPIGPATLWLDERSKDEIGPLTDALGADTLHRLTGKPPDVTPVVYRLAWFRRHQPALLDAAAQIVDVHGRLTGWLTGRIAASWTSADPFGVFDIEEKTWSEPILNHLGLRKSQFPDLVRPGGLVGTLTADAARATGLAAGTPVFAGGGDGQCAGLGVNAARPGVVYLNLGTAQITGAWSDKPRIGPNWRTMSSPTGEGYFLEGCLRAGTFLVDWFIENFAGGIPGGPDGAHVFERLAEEAAALPLGADGVVVCPYLTGCMDPHWNPAARASIEGLGPQHGVAHIYRAILEALALESARCMKAMAEDGMAPRRIIAVGGGANNTLWTQMFADASQTPLAVSESVEASALGAGISAAIGAGWFDDFETAAAAMCREGAAFEPDPGVRAAWDALSVRQAAAYRPR
ncbi:MAG: FGGY-family carbohydrate kinase [Pseudomonadota bacterium]